MKKLFALLLAVTMVLALAAGCGQQAPAAETAGEPEAAEEEVAATTAPAEPDGAVTRVNLPKDGVVSDKEFTLRILCNNEADDAIDAATKFYLKMYPNATIEVTSSTWGAGGSEMREKALIMINGGEAPDIMKSAGIKEFASEGLLFDMTDAVKTYPVYEHLTEGQLSRMTYNGRIYGQTIANNGAIMYANMDILEAAGWDHVPATIDELVQLGADIKAKGLKSSDGGNIYVCSFDRGNWFTDYYVWANGGKLMNEDYTKTLINSPESVKAYTWMQDMVKNGYAPAPDGTVKQLWLNGQMATALDIAGYSGLSEEAGMNWVATNTPVGPTGKRTISIGGAEFGIWKDSELKQEAVDFLQILCSKELVLEGETDRARTAITDLSLYDDPAVRANWEQNPHGAEVQDAIREALNDSAYNFLENPYSYPEASGFYATALQRILINMEDVQTVMDETAEMINAGLAG